MLTLADVIAKSATHGHAHLICAPCEVLYRIRAFRA